MFTQQEMGFLAVKHQVWDVVGLALEVASQTL